MTANDAAVHEFGLQVGVAGSLRLSTAIARVDDDSFGGPQPRLVTAALLVDRHRCWSPDQLADQLWSGELPAQWRPAVRGLVSRTRLILGRLGFGPGSIASRAGHYRVALTDVRVDVDQARDALAESIRAVDERRLAAAEASAADAHAVLSRPVLPGVDAPWAQELRDRVCADLIDTCLLLGQVRRRRRHWAAARLVLREALQHAPYREDVWRESMRVEVDAGNAAQARHLYNQCSRRLADDLDVAPSPSTRVTVGL